MGMPVSITVDDLVAREEDIFLVFSYLQHIDTVFSTYKRTSDIEKINRGELSQEHASSEVKEVLRLCEKTSQETGGYFTIELHGKLDPSGLVKGYAIFHAAEMLKQRAYKNFMVEIAGDIEIRGLHNKKKWKIGIENPFSRGEMIKVVYLTGRGIATSGTYIRGEHIYNPIKKVAAHEIASMSVIGPNVYEADRFATAAFAMGEKGIELIERLSGFEAYMVTKDKRGVYTSGFEQYTKEK